MEVEWEWYWSYAGLMGFEGDGLLIEIIVMMMMMMMMIIIITIITRGSQTTVQMRFLRRDGQDGKIRKERKIMTVSR